MLKRQQIILKMYRYTQNDWASIGVLGIFFLFTASNIFKDNAVTFAGAGGKQ